MSSSSNSEAPSNHQVPCWLSRLYKDDEFEVLDNSAVIIKLMPMNVRNLTWDLAKYLLGTDRAKIGFASQACQMLERYCAAYTRSFENEPSSEWELKKRLLRHKLLLFIGVSLMLASKIESSQQFITTTSLRLGLQRYGKYFTLQEINTAEWELFKIIGCRIPMWTNVQKAQMFVMELSMSEHTMQAVELYMNLIDLQLPIVYEQFRTQVNDLPSPATSSEPGPSRGAIAGAIRVRNMHLVAGVVLAMSRFLKSSKADLALTLLARWSCASVQYIRWIGDILYQHLTDYISLKRAEREQKCENNFEGVVKRCRHS